MKTVIIILLLFFSKSLFAQTTDTLHHADTIPQKLTAPKAEVIDTPVITSQNDNTVNKVITAKPGTGYIINGKVEDANTGEGIPFAPVFFPNTQSGTVADLNGNFVIKVDKLPADTLHVEALGYKAVNKILRK